MIITISDCRRGGYCAAGIRKFCEDNHVDLRDLIRNGIDETTLAAFNDPRANRVIELAKARRESKNG